MEEDGRLIYLRYPVNVIVPESTYPVISGFLLFMFRVRDPERLTQEEVELKRTLHPCDIQE